MKHNTCCLIETAIKLEEPLQRDAIETLITQEGVRHFLSNMEGEGNLCAAEMILTLRERYPITLECVLPYEEQAAGWNEPARDRYFAILEHCDYETCLQGHYSEDCYERSRQYMTHRSCRIIFVDKVEIS